MPKLHLGETILAYTDQGEGQPVILVHGCASSRQQWRKLTDPIRRPAMNMNERLIAGALSATIALFLASGIVTMFQHSGHDSGPHIHEAMKDRSAQKAAAFSNRLAAERAAVGKTAAVSVGRGSSTPAASLNNACPAETPRTCC